PGSVIEPADLGGPVEEDRCPFLEGDQAQWLRMSYKEAKNAVLEQFNRAYLGETLAAANGNITLAARTCGMERQALQRLLKRYRIDTGS
ncbi:sigma-54-dependent Fis family transcriptional regulator, partial [Citrobacter sp. AAK_AS5]